MANIVLISSNSFFIDALRLTIAGPEFAITDVLRSTDQMDGSMAFGTGRCDLVIWDAGAFPDIGNTVIAAIKRRRAKIGILAVLPTYDATQTAKCFAAGCDGVLVSDIELSKLPNHLRLLASGYKVFPDQVADLVLNTLHSNPITRGQSRAVAGFSTRQKQVLELVIDGAQNKGIARELNLPLTTIKADIKSMMRETGTQNRTELAISVLRTGAMDRGDA